MNRAQWGWLARLQEKLPVDISRWGLIVGTYILGEVGFFPFGSTFRLGLGSVFFVLCLYFYPRLATFVNSLLTGMAVVLLRVLVARLSYGQNWSELFLENASAVLYYVALTLGMALPWFKRQKDNPLLTSLYFMGFDFLANLLELAFSTFHINEPSLGILAFGAGIKGLFFLSFIATLELFRQRLAREKDREKFQGQLLLGSRLYAEGYFLKKIMNDIEDVTARSFKLYQEVNQSQKVAHGQSSQAQALLHLAESMHEIKKDAQRVFKSLAALSEPQEQTQIELSELMNLVIESQQRYAQGHRKRIEWLTSPEKQPCMLDNFLPLLVIVNNILANAIDAIQGEGRIAVVWHIKKETLHLRLGNTGEPIPTNNRELIFLPGFTTKYSAEGNASTGIGLTHVRHVLDELKGKIEILETRSTPVWTWFHVEVPLKAIRSRASFASAAISAGTEI